MRTGESEQLRNDRPHGERESEGRSQLPSMNGVLGSARKLWVWPGSSGGRVPPTWILGVIVALLGWRVGIVPPLRRSRSELERRIGDGDQGWPPLRHSGHLHLRTTRVPRRAIHLVRRPGGPRLSLLGSALCRLLRRPCLGAAAITSHRAERPDRLFHRRGAASARSVDSCGCPRLPGGARTGALPALHQPLRGRRGVICRRRGAGEAFLGSDRRTRVPGRRDRRGSALVEGGGVSRADGSGDPAPLAALRTRPHHHPALPGEHLADHLRLQRGNAPTEERSPKRK